MIKDKIMGNMRKKRKKMSWGFLNNLIKASIIRSFPERITCFIPQNHVTAPLKTIKGSLTTPLNNLNLLLKCARKLTGKVHPKCICIFWNVCFSPSVLNGMKRHRKSSYLIGPCWYMAKLQQGRMVLMNSS